MDLTRLKLRAQQVRGFPRARPAGKMRARCVPAAVWRAPMRRAASSPTPPVVDGGDRRACRRRLEARSGNTCSGCQRYASATHRRSVRVCRVYICMLAFTHAYLQAYIHVHTHVERAPIRACIVLREYSVLRPQPCAARDPTHEFLLVVVCVRGRLFVLARACLWWCVLRAVWHADEREREREREREIVCVRACVCACVRVCVRACVQACVGSHTK